MPGTDMADTTGDITDILTDTVTDTTEESGQLMPNQKLMLKLSHGTHMDTVLIHMLMVDTDTHTLIQAITTLARDLLMPNQKPKASHGTDMVIVVTTVVPMAMDTVAMDTGDKPSTTFHQN